MKKIILLITLGLCWGWGTSSPAQEEWNEERSRHFYVFYKNAPEDFVKTVGKAAERSYEEIISNLGFRNYHRWSLDERAKIFIYDDQEDYLSHARQAEWSHGAAYFYQKTIRTFPSAHGFFDSTLPHELGHIVFRDFVGPDASIPLWFDEGVAMYQEKARRWGAHQAVQKAIDEGQFIPLWELSQIRLRGKITREVIELFYAEAASVVYFLITESGEHRFLDFCRKIKVGEDFYQAMRDAYGRFRELQDLEDAWVHYLERQMRAAR